MTPAVAPPVTRARQPGRRWAILSREDIPDHKDPSRTCLRRWRLLQTPWFGVLLHAIYLPDTDRHLHDHPWSFLSIVLAGGYLEERPGKAAWTKRGPGSFAYRRAEDMHRILSLFRVPTWTLVFVGPRRRPWGFATRQGWVSSDRYFADGGRS